MLSSKLLVFFSASNNGTRKVERQIESKADIDNIEYIYRSIL